MKKLIFLPAILLAFYLAIMCVVMFGIIKIHNHDHFGITLTFEIIGLLLLAAVAVVNMIANPPVKTGFFAPLTLTSWLVTGAPSLKIASCQSVLLVLKRSRSSLV